MDGNLAMYDSIAFEPEHAEWGCTNCKSQTDVNELEINKGYCDKCVELLEKP